MQVVEDVRGETVEISKVDRIVVRIYGDSVHLPFWDTSCDQSTRRVCLFETHRGTVLYSHTTTTVLRDTLIQRRNLLVNWDVVSYCSVLLPCWCSTRSPSLAKLVLGYTPHCEFQMAWRLCMVTTYQDGNSVRIDFIERSDSNSRSFMLSMKSSFIFPYLIVKSIGPHWIPVLLFQKGSPSFISIHWPFKDIDQGPLDFMGLPLIISRRSLVCNVIWFKSIGYHANLTGLPMSIIVAHWLS